MVQTTVRPVLTVLRTVRMTIAAALASRPLVGSSCTDSLMSGGVTQIRRHHSGAVRCALYVSQVRLL